MEREKAHIFPKQKTIFQNDANYTARSREIELKFLKSPDGQEALARAFDQASVTVGHDRIKAALIPIDQIAKFKKAKETFLSFFERCEEGLKDQDIREDAKSKLCGCVSMHSYKVLSDEVYAIDRPYKLGIARGEVFVEKYFDSSDYKEAVEACVNWTAERIAQPTGQKY